MTPKKTMSILLFVMLTSIVMPAFAGETIPGTTTEQMTNEAPSQQALNRIYEIRNMDRSHMTSTEKKELRKELKNLKKESKSKRKSGIYLSIGAIIVIGVLLILLLG